MDLAKKGIYQSRAFLNLAQIVLVIAVDGPWEGANRPGSL
jgi:hypothetical protein